MRSSVLSPIEPVAPSTEIRRGWAAPGAVPIARGALDRRAGGATAGQAREAGDQRNPVAVDFDGSKCRTHVQPLYNLGIPSSPEATRRTVPLLWVSYRPDEGPIAVSGGKSIRSSSSPAESRATSHPYWRGIFAMKNEAPLT